MRVPLALFALALATVFACSNGSSPDVTAPGAGTPIGGQPGDIVGPDGGQPGKPDGGTTDGGTGCNLQALPPAGAFALETCTTGALNQTTATFITAGCADVTIAGGLPCHGTLTGPLNAFEGTPPAGGCNSLSCTSTKIPGTIFCNQANGTQCTFQICADITGTNCP